MAFRYRLVSTDGDDLGPFFSINSKWQVGDVLHRNTRDDLRVTAVVEPEEGTPYVAYLVVEAITARVIR
jgi:hypothetical protein